MPRKSRYRAGQVVQHKDGRKGKLLFKNGLYLFWRVLVLTDNRETWWWESEFTELDK